MEPSACDSALLQIRARNQDTVDTVCDTSLWNDNIPKAMFGKCIHCFLPVLIWAAVSGDLLIATHSLWGEDEKMIFPFAFHLLPFRSDTSLLEKAEFPLDAKDIIVFLVVLLCLPFTVCNTFGVRMKIYREVSWSDL